MASSEDPSGNSKRTPSELYWKMTPRHFKPNSVISVIVEDESKGRNGSGEKERKNKTLEVKINM